MAILRGAAVTVFLFLQDETVNEIAKKLGKTATQVLLRWGLQHGSSVLPKSSNSDHLQVCNFVCFMQPPACTCAKANASHVPVSSLLLAAE